MNIYESQFCDVDWMVINYGTTWDSEYHLITFLFFINHLLITIYLLISIHMNKRYQWHAVVAASDCWIHPSSSIPSRPALKFTAAEAEAVRRVLPRVLKAARAQVQKCSEYGESQSLGQENPARTMKTWRAVNWIPLCSGLFGSFESLIHTVVTFQL